jgi:hypothetical protein
METHAPGQSSSSNVGPSDLNIPARNAKHRVRSQEGAATKNPGNSTTNKRKRKKAPVEDDAFHTPWIDSLPMTDYQSKEQRYLSGFCTTLTIKIAVAHQITR